MHRITIFIWSAISFVEFFLLFHYFDKAFKASTESYPMYTAVTNLPLHNHSQV